jgi:hypothetical protein
MSRRNGSLATRALVVTGAGVAVVSAVVVAGAWILADRVASDAAAFVAEGIEGSARESIVMRRVDEVPNVPIPIPQANKTNKQTEASGAARSATDVHYE